MDDSNVQATRRCSKCGQDKPATLEFFLHEPRVRCGLQRRCRVCANEYAAQKTKERAARRPPRPTLAERFWPKVDRSGPVIRLELGPCWVWIGKSFHPGGYGHFGSGHLAHRLAWELTNGPIPEGMHVLHRCDNRPCCRPEHLFLGTNDDNIRDMLSKGRQHRGERTGGAILTEEKVREIRRLRADTGMPYAKIGELYGITMECVWSVVNRRTWKHVA